MRRRLEIVVWWMLPAILTAVLAVAAARSTCQIRYEEMAESVRNPWWLAHGLLYDKVSSNVGWYALLLATYRVFGFYLHAAKVLRVALQAGSLAALAALLRRWLDPLAGAAVLLAWGLSPTFLFLDTSQASFGIDAQVAPILVWLVLRVAASPRPLAQAAPWAAAMAAWLCFPTVAFLLPSLAVLHAWLLRERAPRARAAAGAAAAAGFLAPLALAFDLLRDPAVFAAGAFRGGGEGLSTAHFGRTLGANLADLLVTGASYHFEVPWAEFSTRTPLIAVAVAFAIIALAAKRDRASRLPIAVAAAPLLLGIIIIDMSGGPPGGRRLTPWLVSILALYAVAWRYLPTIVPDSRARRVAVIGLVALPLHHLAVFEPNYVHLRDLSPWRLAFLDRAGTPSRSLEKFVADARSPQGLMLTCRPAPGCRTVELWVAVAAECSFNGLRCKIEAPDLPDWWEEPGASQPLNGGATSSPSPRP